MATQTIKPNSNTASLSSNNEIGTLDFLKGKYIFITGATGFLAKVLIEKILRTVPEVGKIFLMIKGKDEDAVIQRLKNEFIEEELFKCIEKIHGKSYEAFMRSKLVAVAGNVCENNLGMDAHTSNQISNQVHIIINSAATTRFDERYDVAVNTNIEGPVRLLDFAKKCNKLKLFLHISTAYVGVGRGIILEKPSSLGVDVSAEMKLIFDMKKSLGDGIEVDQKMKDLGIDRARIYELSSTYVFTKAIGEMVINSNRENVPIVVVRPTMIQSTYKEPFSGWIQGIKLLDPLLISYGNGQLPGFIGYPEAVFDIVPADMVVNAIIAAMAKHGKDSKPEINVYHVSSSVSNPISYGGLFEFAYDYFTSFPLSNSKGNKIIVQEFKYFDSTNTFSSYITNYTAKQIGLRHNLDLKKQIEYSQRTKRFLYMAKIYESLLCHTEYWFDNSNTKKLIQEMSNEEKEMFGFDVEAINWENYIKNIHLPGLRRNVLREQPMVAARL